MPHSDSVYGYPSVTEILGDRPKPWLQKWKDKWGKRAEQKVAAANRIGTAFHEWVDAYISDPNELYPPSTRLAGMASRFEAWAADVDGEIHHTELKVVSHKYRYEGTLDAIGTYNGVPAVYDWKTSSGIYDDMELQLSAYANAYTEMTGKSIKIGLIVLVSKDKPKHKLTVKEYTLTRRTFNKFLRRLDDFRKFNVKRKPNASVGATLSTDGILGNPSQAAG